MTPRKPKDQHLKVGRKSMYKPEYAATILGMADEGMTFTEIAVNLGVVTPTLRNWGDEHPEFLSSLREINERSLAFYEKLMRELAAGTATKAQFNALMFIMSRRWPGLYSERQETGLAQVEATVKTMTPVEFMREMAFIMEKHRIDSETKTIEHKEVDDETAQGQGATGE